MRWSYEHHNLSPLHLYQLETILFFAAGFFFFFPYYGIVIVSERDATVWQWPYVAIWMTAFLLLAIRNRARIPQDEMISPMRRPIIHWVLLGLSIVWLNITPINLERPYALDLAFAIFSIILADGQWDFLKKKKTS